MNKIQYKWIKPAAFILLAAALAGCQNAADAGENQNIKTENRSEPNNTQKQENQNNSQDDASEEEKDDVIAFESETEVSPGNVNLASYDSPILISQEGSYELTGNGKVPIVIDAEKKDIVLNLKDASITAQGLPAIYVRKAGNVTVNVDGSNRIESEGAQTYEALNAALYSKSDLVLKGEGSLEAVCEDGHGIKAKDTFESENLSLNIQASQDGIHINEDGTFRSGTYTVKAEDEGIQSEQSLTFENGTYNIVSLGDGIRAEDLLAVNDGEYHIETQNEGMESKNELLISNGTVLIQAKDDGLNAANSLVIENGTITCISTDNDGIDSNGDLIINGGTVTAIGLKTPETSFDTDGTPFEINGGTVIGIGSEAAVPTSEDQNVLIMQADQSVSQIEVKQDQKTVISWSQEESAMTNQTNRSILLLSSAQLEAGKEAEIYINGDLKETVTIEAGQNLVGNVQIRSQPGQNPGGMPPQGMPDEGMNQNRKGRRRFAEDTDEPQPPTDAVISMD